MDNYENLLNQLDGFEPDYKVEGPLQLRQLLDKILNEVQDQLQSTSIPNQGKSLFVFYCFGNRNPQRQSLIKINVEKEKFNFSFYNLAGYVMLDKNEKDILARFLWESCGEKQKLLGKEESSTFIEEEAYQQWKKTYASSYIQDVSGADLYHKQADFIERGGEWVLDVVPDHSISHAALKLNQAVSHVSENEIKPAQAFNLKFFDKKAEADTSQDSNKFNKKAPG